MSCSSKKSARCSLSYHRSGPRCPSSVPSPLSFMTLICSKRLTTAHNIPQNLRALCEDGDYQRQAGLAECHKSLIFMKTCVVRGEGKMGSSDRHPIFTGGGGGGCYVFHSVHCQLFRDINFLHLGSISVTYYFTSL